MICGGYIVRVTPVPIPNTDVKPYRAYGTAGEALWESRTLPHLNKKASRNAGLFYFNREERICCLSGLVSPHGSLREIRALFFVRNLGER